MLLALLALFVLGLAAFLGWASRGWDGGRPGAPDACELRILPTSQPPPPPRSLKVVTWNLGFAGGNTGTPTQLHTVEEVRANLVNLADTLQEAAPDLLFLQEVDRPSRRSGHLDQLAALQDVLGLPYACFATTWRLNFVPFPYWPPTRQLGQVWSGQALLSRFPIVSCRRHVLPQPESQPWWYNAFFLHRCLQVARIAVSPEHLLTVVNVHLEAFDQPNREEQAGTLAGLLASLTGPLILAGDFNALPPGAAVKTGFVDEAIDFATDRTVELVRQAPGLREVFLDDAPAQAEAASFTFPTSNPTRRLDYIFTRDLQSSAERRVLDAAQGSDHLPVQAEFPLD
jgi:endonuclease/exonuclease/phosphatase family metal-dependent hydrolase